MWASRLPPGVDTSAIDVELPRAGLPVDRADNRRGHAAGDGPGARRRSPGLDHDLTVRAAAAFAPTSMSSLARDTPVRGTLADIILAGGRGIDALKRIIAAGRTFERALAEWGLGRLFSYGKSLTALFAGEPGTGKTHAAEILASEIGRKLFVINITIGSSASGPARPEKHLHEVFTSVGGQGGVLLFDEADSLFSKRVEVSSSNDKFSNMLTNTLLTEIREEYKGIVLLTTNKVKSIDKAFERRIMYMLTFSLPDASTARKGPRSTWPRRARRSAGYQLVRLAEQFELSGGESRTRFCGRRSRRTHEAGRFRWRTWIETCPGVPEEGKGVLIPCWAGRDCQPDRLRWSPYGPHYAWWNLERQPLRLGRRRRGDGMRVPAEQAGEREEIGLIQNNTRVDNGRARTNSSITSPIRSTPATCRSPREASARREPPTSIAR